MIDAPGTSTGRLVLVIDVGSSAVKASVFTDAGSSVRSTSWPYMTATRRPGFVEQEAADWWAAAVAAVGELSESTPLSEVVAVTITNQQVTTVPVDSDLIPTGAAISWMDTRTSPLVGRLMPEFGSEVLSVVGMPLSTSWAALRPVWWAENQPHVFESARWFLTVDAYFYAKLTGRVVTDHSNACFGPYDIRERAWSPHIADRLGIDVERLPEIVEPGEVVGTLTEAAASEFGLQAGTAVVAGASDQPASAVGLGATTEDRAAVTIGTGTFVVVPAPIPEPNDSYMVSCSGVAGQWINYGLHYVSGAGVDWLLDVARFEDVEELVEEAKLAPPGSEGVLLLPYFQGARTPHFDDHARGVLFGMTLAHTRRHLARAFLESNAFGIRQVLETMTGLDGPQRIRLAGGGAADPFVAQMIADVTGRELDVPLSTQSTSLGAALIAWTALGAFETVTEAVDQAVAVGHSYQPDPEHAESYQVSFETFRKIYSALRPVFGRQAK